jgi:hypothetical protein
MLRRWDFYSGCVLSVSGVLLVWAALGLRENRPVRPVCAAELIGGLGPRDCRDHPWVKCNYDPCDVNSLPDETECSLCWNDSTEHETCDSEDTDSVPCSQDPAYSCPGFLKTGNCYGQTCSAIATQVPCGRTMGQCTN